MSALSMHEYWVGRGRGGDASATQMAPVINRNTDLVGVRFEEEFLFNFIYFFITVIEHFCYLISSW